MLDPRRPRGLAPADQALAGIAALVTEAPWTVEPADLARARAAGLGAATVRHAVALAAFYNYLNRVADATGLDYDRDVVIDVPPRDAARDPLPRFAPVDWPHAGAPVAALLASRPATAQAFSTWEACALTRPAPLPVRDRRVLAHAAARALCDAASAAELADGPPTDRRGAALAAWADELTQAPWRATRADLDRLRGFGLDDAALLDAIGVVGFQNTASRIRLALAAL